jgi:hypothetical protein
MRRLLVVAVAALALIGGIQVAQAAIPDSSTGVITGCYHNSTGALRVIDAQAGQTCGSGQTQLTWNQEGPQGPAGLADLEEVITAAPPGFLQPENETEANAVCPGGKSAISGGFDNIGDLTLRAFFRLTEPEGWKVLVRNDTPDPVNVNVRARVLCATVQ